MWRILFIVLILLFPANTMAKPATDELIDLTNFATNNKLTIDEWQVIIKEQLEKHTAMNIVRELENSYKVTMSEDENIIQYQTEATRIENTFIVSYRVLLPKDNLSHPELVVILDGYFWDEFVEGIYQETIDSLKRHYFSENESMFSWLKINQDDIIEDGTFEEEIINYFNLQEVETQFDNIENKNNVIKKFIYGYTPLWGNRIIINNIAQNVQVAITEDEKGNTEYIIGTPILIHEY
ncbi:YwmB family TATA-box binding protein [Oceanobacillus chungangensis]|uniref:TATA-box binding protein n=1 Tax=Oceanobacillus chungangensis TaxID=1229152 RepID=A0A3D8PWZ6_9BACI|nr:YwmB family TATA-box binding protein [Oceanobacillus chungangensis]RDW20554.1 hypothetical protein CWR45_04780 [Oceanobacillus chungangensis]